MGAGSLSRYLGQAPQYFEAWMRAFGVKGDLPREFDAKTQLSVIIADMQAADLAPNGGVRRFVASSTIGATAGANGVLSGSIPTGRAANTLVSVDRVRISAPGATFNVVVGISSAASPAAGPVAISPCDDRFPSTAPGSNAIFQVLTGAIAGPIGPNGVAVNCPAGLAVDILFGPWIITGNAAFYITGQTANTIVNYSIQWSERVRVKQEL